MHYEYASPLRLGFAGPLNDPSARIAVEGGGAVQMLHRPGPSFHDDPDGAALFPHLGPADVPHSPAFVVYASSLRQVGYRTYLSPGGCTFNDEALVSVLEEERFVKRLGQQDAFPNEDTGLIPMERARCFSLEARQRRTEYLEGETLSLCSFEPSNYGSFLFRVLPKLAGRRHLLKNRRVLAPLYNQTMRDLFSMAGVSPNRIAPHNAQTIYTLDKAIIPSLRNTHALLDEPTRMFYAGLRDRHGSRKGARKIFVSRLGWAGSHAATHRVMSNEETVARLLKAEGFEIIRPHSMSILQQIEAFSAADLIVGPAGSAMFNVVFSRPGTRLIDIESEPHWYFAHMNLFGSCGLNYGIFEAKARDQDWSMPHKPFVVNTDALMARVASLG
jgi:hypothetical protein